MRCFSPQRLTPTDSPKRNDGSGERRPSQDVAQAQTSHPYWHRSAVVATPCRRTQTLLSLWQPELGDTSSGLRRRPPTALAHVVRTSCGTTVHMPPLNVKPLLAPHSSSVLPGGLVCSHPRQDPRSSPLAAMCTPAIALDQRVRNTVGQHTVAACGLVMGSHRRR